LAVHTRFGQLRYSCAVGGTHVAHLGGAKDLPGPKATLFFAPAQIKKRHEDWGRAGFEARLLHAWRAFVAQACKPDAPWLVPNQQLGPQAVQAAYLRLLAGRSDPRVGQMLSMQADLPG
jgi:hypothetical protein